MLLVLGVAGFVGTFLIERFLQQSLYRTLIAIRTGRDRPGAGGLWWFGGDYHRAAGFLGAGGDGGAGELVDKLARTLPDDAEAGGGLMVAIIQLAIAAGAAAGGLVFDLSGYRATFESSAALLVLAAALAFVAVLARLQGSSELVTR